MYLLYTKKPIGRDIFFCWLMGYIPSRDTNKYNLTNDRTLLYLYEDADEVKHITTIAPQY